MKTGWTLVGDRGASVRGGARVAVVLCSLALALPAVAGGPEPESGPKEKRARRPMALALTQSTEGEAGTMTDRVGSTVARALRDADGAMTRAAEVGRRVALRFKEGGRPRTFVLPGAGMSAEGSDQLDEDLAVMTRILEKAIGREAVEPLAFLGSGWGLGLGSERDALYLDGFGALFLLEVDFPLVAPVEKKPEQAADSTDRTWEEARSEVLGNRSPESSRAFWRGAMGEGGPEYDATRVEDLKQSVIRSMKHATHLRGVAEGETIVVSVFGPSSAGVPVASKANGVTFSPDGRRLATRSDSGTLRLWDVETGAPLEATRRKASVLSFRVTKADVDAFAKGDLGVEEFGAKVQVRVR